jgi:hypothetical protein
LEHQAASEVRIIGFGRDQRVHLALELIAAEFDPEIPNPILIQYRDQGLDELDVVFDEMMFSDEDDVVILELADDIILGVHSMPLDVFHERPLLVIRDLGRGSFLGKELRSDSK